MDDLEKAIIISFDESGTIDHELKSRAVSYCQQLKESPSICRVCVERVLCTKFVQVQFWCLQTLQEFLHLRYSSRSPEEKLYVRESVMSMACDGRIGEKGSIRFLDGPSFIKNKLAQVLVTLIYFEYPMIWSSVFVDFLQHLNKGAAVIDMFCRVLNALDDEVISLDYPRNAEEVVVAGRIKDGMRQQCIPQIVRGWYDIVSLYKNSDPDVCTSVLDSLRRCISWIDIGLIANNAFVPMLFELVLVEGPPEQLRGAAANCVLAIVSKRMDPQSKLSMLQSLQMSRVFSVVAGNGDSELISSLAALLTGYAAELLDCSKRLDSEEIKGISTELLDEVLPSVFYVMQNCEMDATFNIVQFLSGYVATMKSLSPLREKQVLHIGQILEVIRSQICYDPVYRNSLNVPDKIGKEEEYRMEEFRKDFLVLLRSVGRVAPDVTQLYIRNSLASALVSSSERNIEEVEAALSLFHALGESISEEAMKTGSGMLRELVPMLLSARINCHSHRLVALAYLETVTRYVKFVQENTNYIPLVLAVFLDERGIHHPNIYVSRRASYLFMRVVKLLKAKLVPYIQKILQSLQDKVGQCMNSDWSVKVQKSSGTEDGSHIFEAIGLLIGMEEVSPEKQSEYLSSLLTPLCHQVKELLLDAKVQNQDDSFEKIAVIQQIVMAINALSKGFSERLVTASRPTIGVMFKQTLDILLQILEVFPKVELLRNKVTSFIHRMVDTLGASVFPYLPKALGQLIADSENTAELSHDCSLRSFSKSYRFRTHDLLNMSGKRLRGLSFKPKEMVSFLVLINQLICKFNSLVGNILEELFPAIASRVFHVLPRDGFPSGPGSNTEEIRELQELQKTFYTFLHVVTTHDLSSVFLSLKSRVYLDPLIQLLLHTSCSHKDILVRKACVQIFIRLIKDWCARPNVEEKVPGFQNFIIETFAINCCLYSVLDKSFEFRDANTLVLFGEIVVAQKVMYEKFGDEFLVHFVSKAFQTAQCPQELAEQYCQKLQIVHCLVYGYLNFIRLSGISRGLPWLPKPQKTFPMLMKPLPAFNIAYLFRLEIRRDEIVLLLSKGSDIKALKVFYQSLIENLRHQQNGSLVFR
ncbi:hypothetical protein Scep_024972 [Stephania cephalantha]|uniref:Exportin-T n=1 Tax=Stephania cephalantha TaxID=152367 RepID=A0AAP0F0E7_9MAGN